MQRVERGEITPDQALVLTFSRRAAAELARSHRRAARPHDSRTDCAHLPLLRVRLAARRMRPVAASRRRGCSPAPSKTSSSANCCGATSRPARRRGRRDCSRRCSLAGSPRSCATSSSARSNAASLRANSPRSVVGNKRDDWVAAAKFAEQYAQVSALREAASYDPAELIRAAAGAVEVRTPCAARDPGRSRVRRRRRVPRHRPCPRRVAGAARR